MIASMRSVNDVAMRTVKVLYNQLIDIGCFSHTLDHVGEIMSTPLLDDFVTAWVAKLRLLWTTQRGLGPPSYSATRW